MLKIILTMLIALQYTLAGTAATCKWPQVSIAKDSALRPIATSLVESSTPEQSNALNHHNRIMNGIITSSTYGFVIADSDFNIIYVNEKSKDMFGYDIEEIKGQPLGVFGAQAMAEEERNKLYETILSGKEYKAESLNRRKDGSTFYCEYIITPILDNDGKPYIYMGVQRDVTERKLKAERDINRYKDKVKDYDYSVYMIDKDMRYVFANNEHIARLKEDEKIFLEDADEIHGKKYSEIHSSRDAEYFNAIMQEIVITGQTKQDYYKFDNIDKKSSRNYTPFVDHETGETIGIVVISKDITEDAKAEELLRGLAISDGLTELFNRTYFMERVGNLIGHIAQRDQEDYLSIIMMDLDYFKEINDTYGHQAGDNALKAVANVLSHNVSAEDIVARYGGDEFIIALPHISQREALDIAKRLKQAVKLMPVSAPSGEQMNIAVSFGVSTFSSKFLSHETVQARENKYFLEMLIGEADDALYSAKKSDRNRVTALPRGIKDMLQEDIVKGRQPEHAVSSSNISKVLTEDRAFPNYIIKTINTDGRINFKNSGYKSERHNIGKAYAGKDVILTPYKGNDWNSGFNVHYNDEHIASYDVLSSRFFKIIKRRTDNKGRFYFGQRYNLGADYASLDLMLHIYHQDGKQVEFSVFFENNIIAFLDADTGLFLRAVARKSDDKGRLYFQGERYNLGVEHKDKNFVLSVYDKNGKTAGFNVFYTHQRLVSYIASKEKEGFQMSNNPLTSPAELKLIQNAAYFARYSMLNKLTETVKSQKNILNSMRQAA
jgi:diguanylate cyclase (GGDEF)-like protein/PAS domain S-box-containing protein